MSLYVFSSCEELIVGPAQISGAQHSSAQFDIPEQMVSKQSSWMGTTWIRRYPSTSIQRLLVGFYPHGNLPAARPGVKGWCLRGS